MASILAGLGRNAFKHRFVVILVWLVILVGSVSAGLTAASAPPDDFSMPGTESQDTFELLEERFPGVTPEGVEGRVVFVAPAGEEVTSDANRAAIEAAVANLATGPQVTGVEDPFETGGVSPDGTAAYTTIAYDVAANAVTAESRTSLDEAMEKARAAGLTVEAGGEAVVPEGPAGIAEIVAIGLAGVILLITLGSLVAAGLPLITALIGVAVSMLSLLALSSTFGLSSTSTTLALMLGLAVGIDYALFVLARYREERAKGLPAREAAGMAVGTAGSAVAFAGLTVVIALVGLTVVGMPMLTKMGLAAAAAVVVAVLIALTLVPAAIGLVPAKILSRSARRALRGRTASSSGVSPGSDPTASGAAQRWAAFVLRRPLWVLGTGLLLLVALAVPAINLRLGMPGDEAQPTTATQRKAYDELAKAFGPGFNGPLMIVVDAQDAPDPEAAIAKIADGISGTTGIAEVSPPMANETGDTALFQAVPTTAPTDAATTTLVNTLRSERASIIEGTGATYSVTGTTAINIDLSGKIQGALLPYLATVVGLAFLLLLLVFRSVLVPVKAALGFLLSVLAALGATVLVFQEGFLADLLGVAQTGPIQSAMPIFMIAVVFGLAMDYEIFLVSRMREAVIHGQAPSSAIETGLRQSSRVVIAAALIMMAVFAGFVTEPDPFIKMLGFSLAAAVFFDAFVVRLAIVPAVLALLGQRAWWLPGWLDRILPRVDVEGAALQAHRPAPEEEPQPVSNAVS